MQLPNTLGEWTFCLLVMSLTVPSIAKEHLRRKGAVPRTSISDQLSSTLNNLQNELEHSDLYDNLQSRRTVLARAIPKTLVDKVGLDALMQRLPEGVSGHSVL